MDMCDNIKQKKATKKNVASKKSKLFVNKDLRITQRPRMAVGDGETTFA